MTQQQYGQLMNYIVNLERTNQQQFERMSKERQEDRTWMQGQFDRVVNNQRRFGETIPQALARQHPEIQQRRRQHANAARTTTATATGTGTNRNNNNTTGITQYFNQGVSPHARLMDRPRCLHDLWEEYSVGYGDNKPAKEFNTVERNNRLLNVKQKYYRRNKVWKLQLYLINHGLNIQAANHKIHTAFGTTRVTKIINLAIKDSSDPNCPFVNCLKQRVRTPLLAESWS